MVIRKRIDQSAASKRFKEAQDRLVTQTADLPLQTLAQMVEDGAIDLQPSFQRRERWSPEKQSALIESFILNVPVPPVYLSEDEYGQYTAIDGKQRLRAIADFMHGRLALKYLETFSELEGARFADLPTDIQNTLKIRPFLRVITLLKQSDPNLKFEVFLRLNRGGESLTPQEIRNVAFRGPLNDLIYSLAKNQILRKQLKISGTKSSAYKAMLDAEYVLRFLALRWTEGRFSGSFVHTMDLFMAANSDSSSQEIDRFKRSFEQAINRCNALWGKNAFRRPDGEGWRDQALAGLYDAEMLAASRISENQFKALSTNKPAVLRETKKLFDSDDFDLAVRQGTNTPSRLTLRIDRVRDMLVKLAARSQ